MGVTKTTTHYQKDTYRERPYEYTYHNVDAYFTYEHSWNKEHNFKAVAGMNYEKYRLVDNIVEQFGLGSDQIDSFNSVNDDTYWLVQQDISAYKTLGFFARINYDYKGKYLFEASMRADGTSRFAKKDRWGYFPSVSAGWRFTEERFMEGVRYWWDNGKIRLSYGALGNQQVSNYLYLQTIGTGTLNYLLRRQRQSQLCIGIRSHVVEPHVGDGLYLQPRPRPELPAKPPFVHGRFLHPATRRTCSRSR